MQLCIEWRMDQITEILGRLRRTLSQSEISRRTGIAQSKISRWEAGAIAAGAGDALKLVDLDGQVAADGMSPAMGDPNPNQSQTLTPQALAATETVAQGVGHA